MIDDCSERRIMCENQLICNHSTPANPLSQTLDELEFERGIWQAALDNNYERVKSLIKKGISVDITDGYGYTALHYACRAGYLEIVKLLLENNANPNVQTTSGKDCPIHRAAVKGHEAIVSMLLKKGADPFLQNTDGQTALHKSVQANKKAVSELLLNEAPMLKDVKDNKGNIANFYLRT